VSAYTYGLNPSDFHAHIEAFLGGRWILFDPTRLAPQSSFVRIGQGRDAADTSFATIFGSAVMNKMELSMQPIGRRRQRRLFSAAGLNTGLFVCADDVIIGPQWSALPFCSKKSL
jgi:transglutaminase-like putative cysteine protease